MRALSVGGSNYDENMALLRLDAAIFALNDYLNQSGAGFSSNQPFKNRVYAIICLALKTKEQPPATRLNILSDDLNQALHKWIKKYNHNFDNENKTKLKAAEKYNKK